MALFNATPTQLKNKTQIKFQSSNGQACKIKLKKGRLFDLSQRQLIKLYVMLVKIKISRD